MAGKTKKTKTRAKKAVKRRKKTTSRRRADTAVLERLYKVILRRRRADPAKSNTARLFSRGKGKIAQKFGEEAVEAVVAALHQRPRDLVAESADVLYHLLVMWASCRVKPAQVWGELRRREGVSGIEEKKARKQL
jgi:phosphoribosyl-ATP pyrophosphohydrolase